VKPPGEKRKGKGKKIIKKKGLTSFHIDRCSCVSFFQSHFTAIPFSFLIMKKERLR
jgi:hypothetical protein